MTNPTKITYKVTMPSGEPFCEVTFLRDYRPSIICFPDGQVAQRYGPIYVIEDAYYVGRNEVTKP